MRTRTTVYTTDTAEARKVAIRAMERTSKGWSIAALREELSDCSVTITSLATALDSARDELAAIRAHCYGPGNESAMDQMLARAKAAEAEVERLRNELDIIANATPSQWEPDMRDQFEAWAQNRARHAAGLTPPTT